MQQIVQNQLSYDFVLYLVTQVVSDHALNEWPSPTIEELSHRTGYSEETILESMEFAAIEPVTLLQ